MRDVHLWVWLLERHSPHHHLLFNLHQDALPACNTATVLATAKPSVLYPTTQNPEVSTSLCSHKMVQSVHSVLAALSSSRDELKHSSHRGLQALQNVGTKPAQAAKLS